VVYGGTGTQSNVVNNGNGTGTETTKGKPKRDGKTPSSSPKEKEISSPDHRKQQYDSNEFEIDPPNSTSPIKIYFGMYRNNIDMGNIDDTTAFVGHGENNI
jgi:hypothetical protein